MRLQLTARRDSLRKTADNTASLLSSYAKLRESIVGDRENFDQDDTAGREPLTKMIAKIDEKIAALMEGPAADTPEAKEDDQAALASAADRVIAAVAQSYQISPDQLTQAAIEIARRRRAGFLDRGDDGEQMSDSELVMDTIMSLSEPTDPEEREAMLKQLRLVMGAK